MYKHRAFRRTVLTAGFLGASICAAPAASQADEVEPAPAKNGKVVFVSHEPGKKMSSTL